MEDVPRERAHYGVAWVKQEPSLSREPQKNKGVTATAHSAMKATRKATRNQLPLGLIRIWKEGIARDAGGSRFIKVVHGT